MAELKKWMEVSPVLPNIPLYPFLSLVNTLDKEKLACIVSNDSNKNEYRFRRKIRVISQNI